MDYVECGRRKNENNRFGELCGVRKAEKCVWKVWKMRSVENEECGK